MFNRRIRTDQGLIDSWTVEAASVGRGAMNRKSKAVFRAGAAIMAWICAFGSTLEGECGVKVRIIGYRGWKKAVEITNRDARLVVVPSIGRIMHYGLTGGENVLWENSECFGKTLPTGGPATENGNPVWVNFGGDKVWPTEQSQWPKTNGYAWPPDHWFDGGTHSFRLLEDGVEITGGASDFNGGRSIREIRLAPGGTRVSILQKIEKVKMCKNFSAEPVPFTNWNVTQIRPPEMVLLSLNPKSRFPERWHDYSGGKRECAKNVRVEDGVAVLRPDSAKDQKIGADSGPWIAGIAGNCLIVELFQRDPNGLYPDGGLSETVYTCPQYTEIELMSPLKSLKIGEALTFGIAWELRRLPQSCRNADERRTAALGILKGLRI